MSKSTTPQPLPTSAYSLGKTSPYANGFFLPIHIVNNYSPVSQYLLKITGGHLPPNAPMSIYGFPSHLVNKKPEVTLFFSSVDNIRPGDVLTVHGASQNSNGDYSAFGEAWTFTVPNN